MFVAGASGVIGLPLCKMLLAAQGIKPVVADAFDAEGLLKIVGDIRPDVVFHELTDLPDGLAADQMEAALVRNARIRDEGTRNLVRAAKAAGVKKIIAQSIAFVYAPDAPQSVTEDAPLLDFAEPAYGETARAVHSLEQQITANPAFIGIVLRYGWLYGAGTGTGFNAPVYFTPPVHAKAAAHAAVLALQCTQSAIYNAADDDARLSSEKAKRELGFDAGFRL